MIGSEPMMPAEDFASALMALILRAHLLAVAQHLGEVGQRLRQAAAGRDWMVMTMAKKFASASGMRSGSRPTASASGMPSVWSSTISWNSERDRLLRFRGDHLQAVDQRQAGLDAAHDHVDGVGEFVAELPQAALALEVHEEMRQQDAAGDAEAERRESARSRAPGERRPRSPSADADADQIVGVLASSRGRPGACASSGLGFWLLRALAFCVCFELLQRVLDAAPAAALVARRCGRPRPCA